MTDEVWVFGVAGGSCSPNVSVSAEVCVRVCVLRTVVRTFCRAADCPDYRITGVADCSTPLSQPRSSNPFSGNGDLYHSNPPCG